MYTKAESNDGAFFAEGNHLIPIVETDVSVIKEVLTIKRIKDNYLTVRVEYTFNNPGKLKEVLVGFEAPSPEGDVDGTPVNGQHPYLSDFTVFLNDKELNYQTALVTDSNYYSNNKIKSKKYAEVVNADFDMNYPNFNYVYYFTAAFKPGNNRIIHTYKFLMSGNTNIDYSFRYILTAANRWANHQIDDFTLKIDLGEFQTYLIDRTFFQHNNQWQVNGKVVDNNLKSELYPKNASLFYVKSGEVVFKSKNFTPKGELNILSPLNYQAMNIDKFNYLNHSLPFRIKYQTNITQGKDSASYKILRNLPYARRGYIFKSPAIQKYYESQIWYVPNPNYKGGNLSSDEQNWLKDIDTQNLK